MIDTWQEKINRIIEQAKELQGILDGEISRADQLPQAARLRLRLKGFLYDAGELPLKFTQFLSTVKAPRKCCLITLNKKGQIDFFDEGSRALFGVEPVNRLLKNSQSKIKFLASDGERELNSAELPWNRQIVDAEVHEPRMFLKSASFPNGRWVACTVSRLEDKGKDKTTKSKGKTAEESAKVIALTDISELVGKEKDLMLLANSMDRLSADMDSVSAEFKLLGLNLSGARIEFIEDEDLPSIPRTTDRPPVCEERNGNSARRALIVDDIPISQKLLEIRLRKHSFQCDFANDGKEALEKALSNDYDLIFMDCDMPVMNGFEASQEIRKAELKTGRHVAIVAMTAYDRADDRQRCLSAGMDEFINKGASENLIDEVVYWCLRRSEAPHVAPSDSELEDEELDFKILKEHYSSYELSEILNSFVQAKNTLMRCLRLAIDEKDLRSIAHFAYSLKGPFATLGLELTSRLTASLTDSAESSDWIDVDEYYDAIAEKCKRILQQVDEFNTKLEKS